MTAAERSALALELKVNEQYLYQCLTGRRAMEPAEAVRVERESAKRVRRWHVRRKDWHLIWPELIGTEGAPPAQPALFDESDAAAPAPHASATEVRNAA